MCFQNDIEFDYVIFTSRILIDSENKTSAINEVNMLQVVETNTKKQAIDEDSGIEFMDVDEQTNSKRKLDQVIKIVYY